MEHDITLSLQLLEQAADCLLFRLGVHNCSNVKLMFPYPEIYGLQFKNKITGQESEWYARLFVSASWAGFALQAGEAEVIEFRARPCSIEPAGEDHTDDYYRWCVELTAGEYLVEFRFRVGQDYFCPDSHYRFRDVQREAESVGAVVWVGEKSSNGLHLARN